MKWSVWRARILANPPLQDFALYRNTNLMGRCTYLDPPKSPLRRGTLRRILSPPD